jgi:hypothetical protein
LQESRTAFSELISEFPDKLRRFRLQKNFVPILYAVVDTLNQLSLCEETQIVDQILSVLQFFIPVETIASPFSERAATIATQIFAHFYRDCVITDVISPMSILLDKHYLMHDVYSCLNVIFQHLGKFFHFEPIADELRRGTEKSFEVGPIVDGYQKLFEPFCSKSRERSNVWTVLFSGGLSIEKYNEVATEIIVREKVGGKGLPLLEWVREGRLKREEGRVKREVRLSGMFEELAELIERDDGMAVREVVKFQTEQILLCTGKYADLEEIITTEALLIGAQHMT